MVEPSRPRIVMTLLVRNEQDVIAENILFHHHQGVDAFIVMDNLSTDSTVEIVRELARSIPIELLHQDQDTYSQSVWVTEMARAAATDHGADWVINNDADEFWMFPGFDAPAYLQRFQADVSGVRLNRHNAVLVRGQSRNGFAAHPCSSVLFEQQSLNPLGSPLPGKCLHRASAQITVEQGNHGISGETGRVVCCDQARILHFPYRRFEHYQAKIRLGGAAYARNTQLAETVGRTWREQHKLVDQPALVEFWNALLQSVQQCIRAEMGGAFFREPRLRDRLEGLLEDWQQQQLAISSHGLLESSADAVRQYVGYALSKVPDFDQADPCSLQYNNLPFICQGPLHHQQQLSEFLLNSESRDPTRRLSEIRDLISLFPRNQVLVDWLTKLLSIRCSHAFRRLKEACEGQTIVLHVSCRKYLERSRRSVQSFQTRGYTSVIVTGSDQGDPDLLGFDFDGELLTLPVPDCYEKLSTKVFYAYLLLYLCAMPEFVVKVDDDLRLHDCRSFENLLQRMRDKELHYCGKLIGVPHVDQCHGWHIDKCSDHSMHQRGYQYPMPNVYASGGFGYIVDSVMLRSCALMYLSMRSFFELNCIQLEDVFVGLAAQGSGIDAASCEYEAGHGGVVYADVSFATLPGLIRLRDE